MSEAPPADRALLEALGALARALDRIGAPYMLIGGLAVIARGVVRDTDDADATVWAPGTDVPSLLAGLAAEGIVGRIPDVQAFAETSQVLLLVHEASRTPMELSLAWLPFEEEAIARAERMNVGGVELPVAVADDLIVYKAVAWRDRDRADLERLLRMHGPRIDLARVRRLVAEFAEALDEPERVAELDRLIARALGPR